MSTLVTAFNGKRLSGVYSSSQDNITVRYTDASIRRICHRLQSVWWSKILIFWFSKIYLAWNYVSRTSCNSLWEAILALESHTLDRRRNVNLRGRQVDLLKVNCSQAWVFNPVYWGIRPHRGQSKLIWLVLIRSTPNKILSSTPRNLMSCRLGQSCCPNWRAFSRLWCCPWARYSLKLL